MAGVGGGGGGEQPDKSTIAGVWILLLFGIAV